MSFPVFLIGPMLRIIAGVVRYALDASKNAQDDAPSVSTQPPTMEFSPLLAELVGSQAYGNAILPVGWLVPEGDAATQLTGAPPAPVARTLTAIGTPGTEPRAILTAPANAGLKPVFVQGDPRSVFQDFEAIPEKSQAPAPVAILEATPDAERFVAAGPDQGIALGEAPVRSGLQASPPAEDLSILGRELLGATNEGQGSPAARTSDLRSATLPVNFSPAPDVAPAEPLREGDGFSGETAPHFRERGFSLETVRLGREPAGDRFEPPIQPADLPPVPPAHAEVHRVAAPDLPEEVTAAPPREWRNIEDQLVHAVRINLESGRTEARLHLDPPDLGAVRIQIVMDRNALSLSFHAENNATRNLLEASLHQLRDSLNREGISVGQMSVALSFDLAGRNSGHAPAPRRVREGSWPFPASARPIARETTMAPALSPGGLDLFA